MGEIAEGILNGDFDEETGEWLGHGQGFPRSFAREKREKNAIRGIKMFLQRRGITDWQLKTEEYAKAKGFKPSVPNGKVRNQEIANWIQEDFQAFMDFIIKQSIR